MTLSGSRGPALFGRGFDRPAVCDEVYIGGRWTPAMGEITEVRFPANEELVATVTSSDLPDVDAAVTAAADALVCWSATPVEARLATLARVVELIDRNADDLAMLITLEVGTPIKLSRRIQVGLPVTVARSILDLMPRIRLEERIGNSRIFLDPIGVVAAITPWNYPLHQTVSKVFPAIAAGCTVVLKPASATPLSALKLAELMDLAEVPRGVFNLILGSGSSVGDALVRHPHVDMVTFTGSTHAGRTVAAGAAETVKKVALELGGKSACVVLDDATLDEAIPRAVRNGLLNSGQTCSAWTRILVPETMHDEACELASSAARSLRIGDPRDDRTQLGPVISNGRRDAVVEHIRAAVDAGLEPLCGDTDGATPPDGHYVAPHIFGHVTLDHRLAQEEIFGPVLAVMPYGDEDHAVEIANGTIYGLSGGVFSGDLDRARRIARRLRTGQVDINGAAFNAAAPFGGVRQSGVGRELGRHGIHEFLETQAVQE